MNTTTAKYTEGHDRLTLNVKFANGQTLRMSCSRSSESMSASANAAPADLKKIFATLGTTTAADGTNGARMLRAKAHLERFDSIAAAAAALA